MDIEAAANALHYAHRRRDAETHSRELVREFPLSMGRPLFHDSRSDPSSSRESFLHILQRIASDEYGGGGASASSRALLEREDPVKSIRRANLEIGRRLKQNLARHADHSRAGKIDKRIHVGDYAKRFGRQTRVIEPFGINRSYQMKNKSEIEELEEKLRLQHIARSSAEVDHLFYLRTAQRETNQLIEDVLIDELWELVEEAFDDEQEGPAIRDLPDEQLTFVLSTLHDGPLEEVLIQKFNVDLTRRHMRCLLPEVWLNDEVINFWFQLLGERDQALVTSGALDKSSHFFNSFFYTKVSAGGYNFINVRRWTRKIDIFAMDKIFVPVNVSNKHWCLAVIHMSEKRIQYYDSMAGSGSNCLNVLFKYLHDEMEHKKKEEFDPEGWELVSTVPGTPQQQNGSDCGVFTCIFADYISQNLDLTFSQNDMQFHRHRMVLHIAQGGLPLEEDL